MLGTSGDQTPLATASIAKVILALCILEKQPLELGQDGPTYTISASDVAIYNKYVEQNGSVVPVTQGEKLTEYQTLVALMLPSANNIADSLVRWVFGNQSAYAAYATDFLQKNGLQQSHIGKDASGLDPGTASTASDLAQLGLIALQHPVLMKIAGQRLATLPVAGTVYNYDTVLDTQGINGLKTGNSDEDPGAFLFTSTAHIGDTVIPITGAVMGASDLDAALQASVRLVASQQQGFEQVVITKAGQNVGTVKAAWGASASILSADAVHLVRWKATPITETHKVDPGKRTGTVGNLKVSASRTHAASTLELDHPLAGPSFWWRLTRH